MLFMSNKRCIRKRLSCKMLLLGAQLRLDLAIYLEISQSAFLAVNLDTGLMYTTVLVAELIRLT